MALVLTPRQVELIQACQEMSNRTPEQVEADDRFVRNSICAVISLFVSVHVYLIWSA